MPDSLPVLAASAAIAVSDIPFNGPISEVRVARIYGKFVINPTFSELEQADMDMVIGGTAESIVMVEGEMSEVSEDEMVAAIEAGHAAIKVHCQSPMALAEACGKALHKREDSHAKHTEDVRAPTHAERSKKYL